MVRKEFETHKDELKLPSNYLAELFLSEYAKHAFDISELFSSLDIRYSPNPTTDIVCLNKRQDVIEELMESDASRKNLQEIISSAYRYSKHIHSSDTMYRLSGKIDKHIGLDSFIDLFLEKMPKFKSTYFTELYDAFRKVVCEDKDLAEARDFIREVFPKKNCDFVSGFPWNLHYPDHNILSEDIEKSLTKNFSEIGSWAIDAYYNSVMLLSSAILKTSKNPLLKKKLSLHLGEKDFYTVFSQKISDFGERFIYSYKIIGEDALLKHYDHFDFKSKKIPPLIKGSIPKKDMDAFTEEYITLRKMTWHWLNHVEEYLDSKMPKLDVSFIHESEFYLKMAEATIDLKKQGIFMSRPKYLDKSAKTTEIIQARTLGIPKEKDVVPNDIISNADTNIFLITGPNNGGKTTYLKTIGQMYYLAHMGVPLPCKSAQISLIDGIYLIPEDRSKSDDAKEGRYLFDLGLMREFVLAGKKDYWDHKTPLISPYSLLLIDEYGNGTDDVEAVNALHDILVHTSKKGTTTYLVSHKHQLAEYISEKSLPGAMNLAATVTNHKGTPHPSYHITRDATELSYGDILRKKIGLNQIDLDRMIYKEIDENRYPLEATRITPLPKA